MPKVVEIHASKQPRRPHYIESWAELRGLKQIDLAKLLDCDRGLVSRWFNGASPSVDYQQRLADLFGCEPDGIFRHPDEDWMKRFFEGRQKDEIERIKATLEAAFPKAAAGGGGA